MLPVAAELIGRIGWLIRLRWLAVLGVIAAVELAHLLLGLALPRGPIYATVAALALYNAVLSLIVRRRLTPQAAATRIDARAGWLARFVMPRTFWGLDLGVDVLRAGYVSVAQIAIDLVFLVVLLHFAGGIENPLIYAPVFHVIVASILLSRRATYLVASLGLLLVAALALGECFGLLPHHPLGLDWGPRAHQAPRVVLAALVVLGLTLYLAAYMCSAIGVRLRVREREVTVLAGELTREAEALAAALEQVRQSEEAKSRYMRKVAHELRGPLGTVQTTLQVVQQGITGEIPERARDLIGRALRRARELGQVTDDLLTLARAKESPRAAEQQGAPSAAQLEPVLDEVLADLRPQAEQAGVGLAAEQPAALPAIRADGRSLRELLGNLVGNALRYTPRGGQVNVRLAVTEPGLLRLEVQDTGIGIAAEDLPHVFDEFFRAANARERSAAGTGLGLAIVKATVERLGGTVAVHSRPGEGTRVVVELPVAAS